MDDRAARPRWATSLGDAESGCVSSPHVAVQSDRVHGDLGAHYAAIDDHVEQVVLAIEAVNVHTTLAVTVPQRCHARSLRVIDPRAE